MLLGIHDDGVADEVGDGLLLVGALVASSLCFFLLACERVGAESRIG